MKTLKQFTRRGAVGALCIILGLSAYWIHQRDVDADTHRAAVAFDTIFMGGMIVALIANIPRRLVPALHTGNKGRRLTAVCRFLGLAVAVAAIVLPSLGRQPDLGLTNVWLVFAGTGVQCIPNLLSWVGRKRTW